MSIRWTPTIDQIGNFNIGATFTKDYGLGQLAADCAGVEVIVEPGVPLCRVADSTAITQADQDAREVARLSSVLERRTERLRRRVGNNRAIDSFDEDAEFDIIWQAFNNIANGATGPFLFDCTNAQFCTEGLTVSSLSGDVVAFTSSLSTLAANAFERANSFERALRRKLIRINGLARGTARRRAATRANSFRDAITTTTISAETQVQLQVANFGTQRFTCSNAEIG